MQQLLTPFALCGVPLQKQCHSGRHRIQWHYYMRIEVNGYITMHTKVREMQFHITSTANQVQNLLEYTACQSYKQSELAPRSSQQGGKCRENVFCNYCLQFV